MLHELMQFALAHWLLVSAFVVALILLFIEEGKSQGGGAGQLSATGLTHLINHQNPVIIDMRDQRAYQDGHIINAKNISATELEDVSKLESYKAQPIVLVDASGAKVGPIAQRLKKAQFEQVHTLKGGMAAWKSADMPVVKSAKSKKKEK